MRKHLYVTRGQLLGAFAKYAVQQSPYHRPDNLELVIDKLNDSIKDDFDAAPMMVYEFTATSNLHAYLTERLRLIPEYTAWNNRKNGNDAPIKFTSRFDTNDNPDDDFIDLDALERNVAREIELEQS